MHAEGLTPILNVSNLQESFAWFERLGWQKGWEWGDPPTFGGVCSGRCEIFLCEGAQGGRGRGAGAHTFGPDGDEVGDKGVWMSIWVEDVDAVHRDCLAAGIEVTWPPTDMPWRVREMHVRHPDGHVFRIGRGVPEEVAPVQSGQSLLPAVDRAVPILRQVSEELASRRPAPGKWSAKEILGHLIDSAANNHQRFVRVRWQDDLVFDGYVQDDWVLAQDYQHAPWPELVTLWAGYNRHLARVMAGVPAELRLREHARHNLDQLAWQPVPADQPATLEYFMADYVAHLEHHLRQIAAVTGLGTL